MDVKASAERFDQAVSSLPDHLKWPLLGIPKSVKATTFEVRMRVGMPIALTVPGQFWFVDRDSQIHNIPRHCFRVTPEDVAKAVVCMCSYSIHSHQHEFADGYISMRGGHRAGVCGTAVLSGGRVSAVRDVTSVNLRIAREVRGAASPLIEQIFKKKLCGVLIAGVPSSGKTTILRDLVRQLAGGEAGRFVKVAVVDERGELGAVFEGVPQNDLGVTCDILSGYPKGEGILTAIRTLSPQIIVCDEIGGSGEADSMLEGLNCGVKLVATAHAASIDELAGRRQIARLLRHGAFEKLVRLGDADTPGRIEEIREAGERYGEAAGAAAGAAVFHDDGDRHDLCLI